MSILLSAHRLRKSFAARPLFDELTFSIESGERIGLIGPNGAGKSTLLRILASKTSPDDGTLSFQRGLRVGYLEQVPNFRDGATVLSTALEGTADPDDWENMGRAQTLLSKLSLDGTREGITPETPVARLSGGWKKRVALARELVRSPDLLLLDEPTNHLDVESILWLEDLIAHSRFATLTITHDRLFLQRISNRILELDRRNPGGLLSVKGDYATYLETKEQNMAAQERREVILKNTLRRETEWLRRGAKARTTKQQARIQRAETLQGDVAELTERNRTRTVGIEFQSTDRSPKKLLEAKGISKSYSDRVLFKNVDLLLTPGSRIGLLGENGCGKSSLIRVLLGQETPDQGSVFRSDQLKVAYFEQARDSLDPNETLSKTLCPKGEYVDFRGSRVHIRSYLDRFLFDPGQAEMAVGKLSGGEQSRLLLAKLMLNDANLLVLDEPTNDLDMATLSILEEVLTEFTGAVLLVTHDRYFLDQVATKILAFPRYESERGNLVSFADVGQWESWHAEQEALQLQKAQDAAAKAAAASAQPKVSTDESASKKKRKLSYNEQRELDSMEKNIQEAETLLAKLTEESTKPENLSNAPKLAELFQEIGKTQASVDYLYARWSELTES
jgi:ATP-binding cassette subfamily F protein uup